VVGGVIFLDEALYTPKDTLTIHTHTHMLSLSLSLPLARARALSLNHRHFVGGVILAEEMRPFRHGCPAMHV
jgi:hypothetical protein